MKKGKKTMMVTIGIACFALATVMTMQFKVVNETDITAIENMQEAELKTELANWKTKYDQINTQCEETASKLDEYKNDEAFVIMAGATQTAVRTSLAIANAIANIDENDEYTPIVTATYVAPTPAE